MFKSLITVVLLTFSLNLLAANISVNVKGMTCQMCVKHIKHEFSKRGKTQEVNVDVEKGLVTLIEKKDIKLTDDEITQTIKSAGYEAVEIQRK